MKKLLLIIPVLALLAVAGCSSARKVEERARLERCDSLRALLAEELTVRLDDVRIIPPDSIRPRVKVAAVRIERARTAQIEAVETETGDIEKVETPEPQQPMRSLLKPMALLVLIALLIYGALKGD
ncbi:MAG: hypothetical protein K2L05_01250 [Muribaculaceae bacterium]|nr:hypothetical protein [Muribaculaceae bacterium]